MEAIREFQIFEGECPDCLGDLHETSRSTLTTNDNPDWYEFKCCQCEKIHYIEQTAGGDWASN